MHVDAVDAGELVVHELACIGLAEPSVLGDGGQVNSDVDQEASFVSSITHEGASSADLTVVFVPDATIAPSVLWTLSRP